VGDIWKMPKSQQRIFILIPCSLIGFIEDPQPLVELKAITIRWLNRLIKLRKEKGKIKKLRRNCDDL
jgi:hypothetical protein